MSDTALDTSKKPADGVTQDPAKKQETVIPEGGTDAQTQVSQKPSKLFMGATDDRTPPADDEVTRLRAELQSNKVEQGRVKSLAAKIKEQEAELESLRLKAAEADKGGKGKSLTDFVDPSRRDVVDEDILHANEDMIRGSQKDLLAEVEKRVSPIQKTLEEERAARIRAEGMSFDSQIEQLHKGFAAETNPGGKFVDKWTAYLAQVDRRTGLKNGEILSNAYNERRIDGVNDMIDDFKRQTGISRQESMKGSAFPGKQTPYVAPGDGTNGDAKRYTISQYKAELAESGKAYQEGRITAQERKNVLEKFKRAANEGRIVNDPASQVGV
jgi:hypothetical protein